MVGLNLTQFLVTSCESRELLLILDNTIQALGQLAKIGATKKQLPTLQSFCRNELGMRLLLNTEPHLVCDLYVMGKIRVVEARASRLAEQLMSLAQFPYLAVGILTKKAPGWFESVSWR